MKKIVISFLIIGVIVSLGIIGSKYLNEYENSNKNNALISYYVETGEGTGVYEKQDGSTWPADGYVLNTEKTNCTNGTQLSWDSNTKSVVGNFSKADKCKVYFDVQTAVTLANYIKSLYTTQGAGGLYLHNSSLANSANDGSYRYAGANPNNYVCFGSNTTPCPADNVYRIIGVFGEQVKLIKSTSLGNMAWDSGNVNTWSSASLNTYLNGTYLTSLGAWADKIVSHDWQVGGMPYSQTNTAKQYYDVEIPKSGGTIYKAKIGLMYVSDYGFAATSNYWTTELYNYEPAKSSDWLNINVNEWTISRDSAHSDVAFCVRSTGYVDGFDVYNSTGVRPSFYLDSKVTYEGGSGSAGDPMKIG